jgi:glucose-6-phosphate 1-epimerase
VAQSLDELKRLHSVDGAATWEAHPAAGLPMLFVRTDQCEARMFAHGAHVASWTPAGQRPGLHLSPKSAFDPKKAIRGGVPICFPWFGNFNKDAGPQPGDPDAKPGAHGFVRARPWNVDEVTLEENGRVRVVMTTHDDDETHKVWDARVEAKLIASLGQTMSVTLEVTNPAKEDLEIEEALHTYLEVGDVTQISVIGLEGTDYIDKVDGFKTKHNGRDPIRFTGEMDAVFMGTKAAVTVVDPVLQRHLKIDKTGSTSTVVWNPWLVKAQAMPDVGGDDWKSFVCVEAANARPHHVTVPAGATHVMSTRITVIPQTRNQ